MGKGRGSSLGKRLFFDVIMNERGFVRNPKTIDIRVKKHSKSFK